MNILVIGTPSTNILTPILSSKRLDKLYTATSEPVNGIANIEYKDFDELAFKSIALRIDIAITIDKDLIEAGIADVFRKKHIGIIAVNKKWFNLESSNLVAKQLLAHYSINTPTVIKAPLAFPIVLKTDTNKRFIIPKMNDLVSKMENMRGEKTFLEEYLDGTTLDLITLWDGESMLTPHIEGLTEVQEDRLDLYKTKLNFMLSDEKADFVGFFVSNLIWAKNDWYVLSFKMRLDEDSDLSVFKKDLVYLFNSAIYCKLNEIE